MIEKMAFGDPLGEGSIFGSCEYACANNFNEDDCDDWWGSYNLTNKRSEFLANIRRDTN